MKVADVYLSKLLKSYKSDIKTHLMALFGKRYLVFKNVKTSYMS